MRAPSRRSDCVAFLVVGILGEGETGLRRRQQLARPDQPVRVVRLVRGVQAVGSVTSADSDNGSPGGIHVRVGQRPPGAGNEHL